MINHLVAVDYETGRIFWKARGNPQWDARYSGVEAFKTKDKDGYLRGKISGKYARAHQVVWCSFYGEWPNTDIDHINGDKSDNSINNLRSATKAQNQANRGVQKNNTSGYKGVSFKREKGKWCAKINVKGKSIHLGYFDSASEASDAYISASLIHNGDFHCA